MAKDHSNQQTKFEIEVNSTDIHYVALCMMYLPQPPIPPQKKPTCYQDCPVGDEPLTPTPIWREPPTFHKTSHFVVMLLLETEAAKFQFQIEINLHSQIRQTSLL